MIFNQWNHPECKGYSFLGALKILKPEINHESIISAINEDESGLLTNRKAGEFFKSRGFINDAIPVPKLKVKWLLTKSIPLISWVNWVDWKETNKPPYIVKWDNEGVTSHSIVLQSFDPKTRIIKCQNSWWEEWWENWCFYIHADDFSRLMNIYRIIP